MLTLLLFYFVTSLISNTSKMQNDASLPLVSRAASGDWPVCFHPEARESHPVSSHARPPSPCRSLWEDAGEGPEQAALNCSGVPDAKGGRQIHFTSFVTGDCELVWTLASP